MRMLSKGRYALIAVAAAAGLGIMTRNRTPADIRRFEYHSTLIEEAYSILTDPLQVGMLVGAMTGAIGVALLRAGDMAASTPRLQTGLLLQKSDPALLARATRTAEQATARVLEALKN